jgi:hypothetical protein
MNKFLANLEKSIANRGGSISAIYDTADAVKMRVLREYGAAMLATNGAVPPNKIIFRNNAEVDGFQRSVSTKETMIGGYPVELQAAAMDALSDAIDEAKAVGLDITPRSLGSAKRSYDDTVSLWLSRVLPGLEHWSANGKISEDEASRIRGLSPYEQVSEILALEQDEIFFAKDLSKSIMYSVAPPGTSQHLSMLALDVAEFDIPRVREILARHRWFQTVISDLPHFTYLGLAESELPHHGLKRKESGDRYFWVPDLPD